MEKELLSIEDKQRIISKIKNVIQDIECPICHNKNFVIADGYFISSIRGDVNGMTLGGPSIPSIGIICDKCGFISHHALGILGLLSDSNTTNLKTN